MRRDPLAIAFVTAVVVGCAVSFALWAGGC